MQGRVDEQFKIFQEVQTDCSIHYVFQPRK